MHTQFELTVMYLLLGAKLQRQVEIIYMYLDKPQKRYGSVQPIKWCQGRKGLHILTWDTEKEEYRRFAVENIQRVNLTDKEWVKEFDVVRQE
jgi:predicted DNA-binding transcriptional regulator YafY